MYFPDLNANAGAGIEIVQFNEDPVYTCGADHRPDQLFRPDANVYLITVPLPWSTTLSTTLPATPISWRRATATRLVA
jgi:hypothetical protein